MKMALEQVRKNVLFFKHKQKISGCIKFTGFKSK